MRYFVLTQDGHRYGPADIAVLNLWIAEGRLQPNQWVEEEGTGQRHMASAVFGLQFGLAGGLSSETAYINPPPPANYYQRGPSSIPVYGQRMPGSQELSTAWVMCVIAFLCFPPFSIAGIVFANKAQVLGNSGAKAAIVANVIALALGCLEIFGLYAFTRML